MSERIEVGDLVMMVRCDHACAMKRLGYTFVVADIPTIHPGLRCQWCGQSDIGAANEPICRQSVSNDAGLPQRWLKRIPPLTELERADIYEKVTA